MLTDCFGNILSTNKKSNALLNLDSLNKDACIFNYIPQLLWHFFKYDEQIMDEQKPRLDELYIRKDNEENLDMFCFQLEKSYNYRLVFERVYPFSTLN